MFQMFFATYAWFFFSVLSSMEPEAVYAQELDTFNHSDLRQDIFITEKFHYLNGPRIGIYTVYNVFDCTFVCLRNPSCLSLNLAASKGDNGKFWCELLSSQKYSNSMDYTSNKTSHHLNSILKTSCVSSPCRNGGTCVPNYKYPYGFDCRCKGGFIGELCGIADPKSCKELYDVNKLKASWVVNLFFDSKQTSVFCHMGDFGCGDGGWTPVIKMDGNKQTFHYNSPLWSNNSTFNVEGGKTGFDSNETKLPSYWKTPFSKICLGMKSGENINFIVITKQANSLYSLIVDGTYRNTSLGRDAWKSLIGSQVNLQSRCNKEGFNVGGPQSGFSKARIGILGNNEDDCESCDTRIGFGTGGWTDDSNTCGNNGNKAIGFILVQ